MSDQQHDLTLVRQEFTEQWQQGNRPRIEEYLQRVETSQQDELFIDLLNVELKHRASDPTAPSPTDYGARFPQFQSAVRQAFVQLSTASEIEDADDALTDVLDTPPAPSPLNLQSDHSSAPNNTPAHNRFRFIRSHAKGGLGQVSVALDEQLQREVALKEIQEKYADHVDSQERFRREAEITGRLEHPGVVPIYALGKDENARPYYAMRLIHGDSLRDAISRFHKESGQRTDFRHNLEFRQLLNRFIDVCNTIAYAHSRGILHRDLKPDNIMLGKYGETLVVDWGLAKRMTDKSEAIQGEAPSIAVADDPSPTQTGAILGTPAFMSPEQASGNVNELGPQSDIYSLGASFFSLLTNRVPGDGASVAEIIDNTINGKLARPRSLKPTIPKPLESICLKALALKPQDRYPTAKDLGDDIERWLADEPVQAWREPWRIRAGRWLRRHRNIVVAAVASLLVALVSLTIGLVLLNRERERTQGALHEAQTARGHTREAFDELSTFVLGDLLKRQQIMTPEHEKFLLRTLQTYERFASETGKDEATRAGVARAYDRIGEIREELGQTKEAAAAHHRSIQLYQALFAEHQDNEDYGSGLAGAHMSLGLLLSASGKIKQGETELHKAMRTYQKLSKQHPTATKYRAGMVRTSINLGMGMLYTNRLEDAANIYNKAIKLCEDLSNETSDPAIRLNLASAYMSLGVVHRFARRFSVAKKMQAKALRIYKELIDSHPHEAIYQEKLGYGYLNHGLELRTAGENDAAEDAYRSGLYLARNLAANFPTVPRYQRLVGLIGNNLGYLLYVERRYKEAKGIYDETLAVRKRLRNDFSKMPDHHSDYAATLSNVGLLYQRQKDYSRSRDYFEPALENYRSALNLNSKNPEYKMALRNCQGNYTQTLLRLGDHAAAAESVEKLVAIGLDPAKDNFNGGWFLARCVPLVRDDDKLEKAKRQKAAERYAGRALQLLDIAVQNGYRDAKRLQNDDDFDSLRDRPTFQTLIRALTSKTKR